MQAVTPHPIRPWQRKMYPTLTSELPLIHCSAQLQQWEDKHSLERTPLCRFQNFVYATQHIGRLLRGDFATIRQQGFPLINSHICDTDGFSSAGFE